jgi:hypothetical protein
VSVLIGLIVIACIYQTAIHRKLFLTPLQKAAAAACACTGLPLMLAQLSGTNHLLRHISPALIPIAIVVALLADGAGWTRSAPALTVSSILLSVQFLMIVIPVVFPNRHRVEIGFVNGSLPWRVMIRFDQWNWQPVQEISDNCGVKSPHISYLGGGRVFNPPAIEYPWVARIAATRLTTYSVPEVQWLWRYEDGPIGWPNIMAALDKSDIVLTAPQYIGDVTTKENLDNQHNAEFAARLSQDPRFESPISLKVGRFAPVEVLVFLKKTLVCRPWHGSLAKDEGRIELRELL